MGIITKLLIVVVAIVIGLFFAGVLFPEPEAPEPKDGWWGRGPRQPDTDTSLRDFKVSFSDEELQDLHDRLDRARFGEELVDTQFQYGFSAREIKIITEYWRNKYDWRTQEAELNKFPQFKTTVEGTDVHFLRVKPKSGRQGKPLLIVHGWPGSVWEFYKIIPMLTDPAAHGGRDEDAFEVIAPSIPGYGFSEAPHRTGFAAVECAGVFVKLMSRLGHDKFYAQGGDWGAIITTAMAQVYPRSLYGYHNNMVAVPFTDPRLFVHQIAASYFPNLVLGEEHSKHFRPMSEDFLFLLQESGYFHIQATKPDTVGAGLNDSPMGLAGYILEKFSTWTNLKWRELPDGGLTKKFTLDELLTNVMIYWISGNIASSQRFYKENILQWNAFDRVPVKVPCGLAVFPEELANAPRPFAEYKYKDIVQYTYLPRGGHFAAFEEPQLLAEDFLNFVEKLEKRDKITFPTKFDEKVIKEKQKKEPIKDKKPELKKEPKEQTDETQKQKSEEKATTKDNDKAAKEKTSKNTKDTKKDVKNRKTTEKEKPTKKDTKQTKPTKEATKPKKETPKQKPAKP